jgi:Predicted membrane protein (DUF2079)
MSAISDREPVPRVGVGTRERPSTRWGRGYMGRLRQRWNDQELTDAPARDTWPLALRRARTIGFVALGIELVVLIWWGAVLTHRFSNTWDFSVYYQAAHLISVGHFSPYSTEMGETFMRNAFELFVYPLAAVLKVFPHAGTLKVIQAFVLVAAQAVALTWIAEIAATASLRRNETRIPVALIGLGTLLLIANPWYIWAGSFDIHPEVFMALFLVAAARDLLRGSRWAWLWAALALASSAVGATCVLGLGVSVALSGRCWWRRGAGIALMALIWLGFLAAVHDNGSTSVYAYLINGHAVHNHGNFSGQQSYSAVTVITAVIKHPLRVISILWSNHTNIWALLAATGLIGFFWPPVILPVAIVILEGGLLEAGTNFSVPGDQNIELAPLVAVGTVAVLAWLYGSRVGHRRFVMPAVLTLLAVNAVIWGATWFPQVSARWLRVSPAAAAQLRKVAAKIGPNDEVISSQGIVGNFADRRWVYSDLGGPLVYSLNTRTVWIVLTPSQGIEGVPVQATYAEIAQIAALPGIHRVSAKAGVWAFEWHPPAGTTKLRLHRAQTVRPWAITGVAGKAVLKGKQATWYAESTAKRGYTLDKAYWRKGVGRYRATVSLSVAGTANVEVWDTSRNRLLARTVLQRTGGVKTVQMLVQLRSAPGEKVYDGWGIWRILNAPPPPGDNLEIRVWSPGGVGKVKVYTARIVKT